MNNFPLESSINLLRKFFKGVDKGIVLKIIRTNFIDRENDTAIFSDQSMLKISYDEESLYINDQSCELLQIEKCKELIHLMLEGFRRIDFLLVDSEVHSASILKLIVFDSIQFRTVLVVNNSQKNFSKIENIFHNNYYKYVRNFNDYFLFCRRNEDAEILKYKKVISDNNYWITENVLCQVKEQSFSSVIEYFDDRAPFQKKIDDSCFVHILNPYHAPPGSETHKVMKATFRSIETALNKSENKIKVISTSFADEELDLPHYIKKADDLKRSSEDFLFSVIWISV